RLSLSALRSILIGTRYLRRRNPWKEKFPMPSEQKKFLKIVLATLALAPELNSPHRSLILGIFLAAVFLAVVHFFKIIRPLFPPKFFRFAALFGIASLFQWSLYVPALPVFWILSFGLL